MLAKLERDVRKAKQARGEHLHRFKRARADGTGTPEWEEKSARLYRQLTIAMAVQRDAQREARA